MIKYRKIKSIKNIWAPARTIPLAIIMWLGLASSLARKLFVQISHITREIWHNGEAWSPDQDRILVEKRILSVEMSLIATSLTNGHFKLQDDLQLSSTRKKRRSSTTHGKLLYLDCRAEDDGAHCNVNSQHNDQQHTEMHQIVHGARNGARQDPHVWLKIQEFQNAKQE